MPSSRGQTLPIQNFYSAKDLVVRRSVSTLTSRSVSVEPMTSLVRQRVEGASLKLRIGDQARRPGMMMSFAVAAAFNHQSLLRYGCPDILVPLGSDRESRRVSEANWF